MFKLLLVDDEPLILSGLQKIINWEEYGIEIAGTASNGEDALLFLEHTKVDFLLTDIMMSRLDGLGLIERAKEKFPNLKCVILSGYEEFQLVKKAMILGIENYLVKPVNQEELADTINATVLKLEQSDSKFHHQLHLREAVHTLKENVLLRVVNGLIGRQELTEKTEFLNLDIHFSHFNVTIIRIIKNKLEKGESGEMDDLLISYGIKNITQETLSSVYSMEHHVLKDYSHDIVILSMTDNKQLFDEETFKLQLREVIRNVRLFLKQDVFVTIGSVVTEISELRDSYNHAKGLLDYSLISTESLLSYDEMTQRKQDSRSRFQLKTEELEIAMRERDIQGAKQYLDWVYLQLKQAVESPALIYEITMELLFHMIQYARILRYKDIQTVTNKEHWVKVLQARTLEETNELLKEALTTMIREEQQRNDHKNPIISDIIDYVNQHYNQEINLQFLADQFHLNTAYLGQLFKKETGELFSNYLNRVRIDKAKQLLRVNSYLKANVVAQEVGYQNPHYFYKVFKKMTGQYPTEYKGG